MGLSWICSFESQSLWSRRIILHLDNVQYSDDMWTMCDNILFYKQKKKKKILVY